MCMHAETPVQHPPWRHATGAVLPQPKLIWARQPGQPACAAGAGICAAGLAGDDGAAGQPHIGVPLRAKGSPRKLPARCNLTNGVCRFGHKGTWSTLWVELPTGMPERLATVQASFPPCPRNPPPSSPRPIRRLERATKLEGHWPPAGLVHCRIHAAQPAGPHLPPCVQHVVCQLCRSGGVVARWRRQGEGLGWLASLQQCKSGRYHIPLQRHGQQKAAGKLVGGIYMTLKCIRVSSILFAGLRRQACQATIRHHPWISPGRCQRSSCWVRWWTEACWRPGRRPARA